jgi:hypothetical protein
MGPAGVVVTIADWMLDPVVCAGILMQAAGLAVEELEDDKL